MDDLCGLPTGSTRDLGTAETPHGQGLGFVIDLDYIASYIETVERVERKG